MKSIHHSHWHTSVYKHGTESLYGKTAFLSTGLECSAGLRVNIKTFRIEKARWEIYRGPDGPVARDIEDLYGVEAYLGSGGSLRSALAKECGEHALSLFSEIVRGIIQAETFLYQERGYVDQTSYVDCWSKMYLDTCRYYSNLDRTTIRWEEYVAGQNRFNNLFNRFKGVSVSEPEDRDQYFAYASLSDSFHEVGLDMTLDKNLGTVTFSNCRMLRGPDPVCHEATAFMQNLQGQKLAAMSKKEIAQTLEGNQGCIHMIDLCCDLSNVVAKL